MIASKLISAEKVVSFWPPSASLTHGYVGYSVNHSRVLTGTTPRASTGSWSFQPTVRTRSGCFSIVVEPNLCAMLTGNAAAVEPDAAGVAALSSVDAQAVRVAAASRPAAATVRARRHPPRWRFIYGLLARGPLDH